MLRKVIELRLKKMGLIGQEKQRNHLSSALGYKNVYTQLVRHSHLSELCQNQYVVQKSI